MRVANRVVGQLQVLEQVHLTAGPLSLETVSGLVIQNVDAVLSDGIRMFLAFWPSVRKFLPSADLNGARFVGTHGAFEWHLVRIARLWTNWLPCSTASSRKKQ